MNSSLRSLYLFIYSIRQSGYSGAISVLTLLPINHYKLDLLRNALTVEGGGGYDDSLFIIQVKPLTHKDVKYSNGTMCYGFNTRSTSLTKLTIFNMTEYDEILYYDIDTVFLRNPDMAFKSCRAGEKNICSVADPNRHLHYKGESTSSFPNSGKIAN